MGLPVITQTLSSRDIKVLHIEPTDVCQAACPLCARETDIDFDKSVQHHLTVGQLKERISNDTTQQLNKLFMCGNYGDPAAGKYTKDIYQWARSLNPSITLGMNTNGGLQNTDWWYDLGKLFSLSEDYVVFSIDGLEDTNHIYRKNVNWKKLMENAAAFIAAGGSAHWDMLIYRHNQHQVEQAQELAKEMGFTWFRAKVSRRPLADSLEFPVNWLEKKQSSITTIDCFVLKEQSLYIDAQGRISPCCWLGATQNNVIVDFDAVQNSWTSTSPNPTCAKTCGTAGNTTEYKDQWRLEVQLC